MNLPLLFLGMFLLEFAVFAAVYAWAFGEKK